MRTFKIFLILSGVLLASVSLISIKSHSSVAGSVLSNVSCLPGPEVTIPKIIAAKCDEVDQLATLLQEKIEQIVHFLSMTGKVMSVSLSQEFQAVKGDLQADLSALIQLKADLNLLKGASVYEYLVGYPEKEKRLESVKSDLSRHLENLMAAIEKASKPPLEKV